MLQKIQITTERLIIRNLKLTDVDAFHAYRSNPEVARYQGFDVMTLAESARFIEVQKDKLFGNAGEWVQFGIENKLAKKIIGDCAIKLDPKDTRIATIGITISHLEQRKGFAKETLSSILDFLFDLPDFHRVQEIVDAENIASIRLLQSLGFKQEGHFIQNIFFNGKWGSEFQYAMLKSEWKK
jgi:RimJ/RimL family protein N-acetyltransferase